MHIVSQPRYLIVTFVHILCNFAEKSASVAHTTSPGVVLDRDMSRLLDISLPWRNASVRSSTKEWNSQEQRDQHTSGISISKGANNLVHAGSRINSLRRKSRARITDKGGAASRAVPSPHRLKGENRKHKEDKENLAYSSGANIHINTHSRSKSVPRSISGNCK